MKKVIGLLCVFLLSTVIITGCSKTDNNTTNMKENDITNNNESSGELKVSEIIIEVNGKKVTVSLEDNSSTVALVEKLKNQDIVVEAHDYGDFEKVGELGFSLPRNDTQITTKAGDLILYQGNQLSLYYDVNSWNFTKLGEIKNTSTKELKELLGSGDVKLTLKKID